MAGEVEGVLIGGPTLAGDAAFHAVDQDLVVGGVVGHVERGPRVGRRHDEIVALEQRLDLAEERGPRELRVAEVGQRELGAAVHEGERHRVHAVLPFRQILRAEHGEVRLVEHAALILDPVDLLRDLFDHRAHRLPGGERGAGVGADIGGDPRIGRELDIADAHTREIAAGELGRQRLLRGAGERPRILVAGPDQHRVHDGGIGDGARQRPGKDVVAEGVARGVGRHGP